MAVLNGGVLDGVRRISARVRDLVIDGGIAGAPLGLRIRGATTAGAPSGGTWKAGDVVIDRNGATWVCTAGGTPGAWVGALISSQAGVASTATTTGIATLDTNGLVPATQLPVNPASLFLAGTGVPAAGLGLNGDTYQDVTTGIEYAKSAGAWAVTGVSLALQATTGPSGFTKVTTGVPATILTWTAPNDGKMHRVICFAEENVTATQTGGTCVLNFTTPSGQAGTASVIANNGAAGVNSGTARPLLVQANSTVTLQQTVNVTAGGPATVWAELWGS